MGQKLSMETIQHGWQGGVIWFCLSVTVLIVQLQLYGCLFIFKYFRAFNQHSCGCVCICMCVCVCLCSHKFLWEIFDLYQVEVLLNSASGQIQPYDIAIDPYSRTLYWTCSMNNVVNVTRLDMTPVGVVLQAPSNFKPRSIALFPERGYVENI